MRHAGLEHTESALWVPTVRDTHLSPMTPTTHAILPSLSSVGPDRSPRMAGTLPLAQVTAVSLLTSQGETQGLALILCA
jgi:hypothetical protein